MELTRVEKYNLKHLVLEKINRLENLKRKFIEDKEETLVRSIRNEINEYKIMLKKLS